MNAATQVPVRDWLTQANQFLADLPNQIDRIDLWAAVLLVPLGVVSLLYGYRIFKGVVVVYSSVVGAAAGWWLAAEVFRRPDFWWLGLLVGGVLMAAIAWPLVNLMVGVWGAVAGALAGYAVTQALGDQRVMLVGVGVGLVLGALLALVVFRFMIMLMTSILGSHLAVVGLIALVYRVDAVAPRLRAALTGTHYLLPAVVAGPALFGIIYQICRSESRESREDRGRDEKKE